MHEGEPRQAIESVLVFYTLGRRRVSCVAATVGRAASGPSWEEVAAVAVEAETCGILTILGGGGGGGGGSGDVRHPDHLGRRWRRRRWKRRRAAYQCVVKEEVVAALALTGVLNCMTYQATFIG